MAQAPAQTFYVVVPPLPADFTTPPMRPVSRLLQEDEETVAKRLATGTFHLLKRFAKRDNAEGLRNQLHALGLETYVISDQQVHGHLFIWAESANQGAGGMAIKDFGGQPLYCPYEDLLGICTGEVELEGGGKTVIIDLHRKSAAITPRIDGATFEFAATLGQSGVGPREFLDEVEAASGAHIDRHYGRVAEAMTRVVKGLATLPSEYMPPDEKLPVPYVREDLRRFNAFSFLLREWRAIEAAKSP